MEYPSKRMRLSGGSAKSQYTSSYEAGTEQSAGLISDAGITPVRLQRRHQHHAHVHAHAHAHLDRRDRAHQKDIHREPRQVQTATATATVVDVIIQDGTSELAALTVPNVPTVISIGAVEVTIGASTATIQVGSTATSTAGRSTSASPASSAVYSSLISSTSRLSNTSSSTTMIPSSTSTVSSSLANHPSSEPNSTASASTITSTSTLHVNSTLTSTYYSPVTVTIGNSTRTLFTTSSSAFTLSSQGGSHTSSASASSSSGSEGFSSSAAASSESGGGAGGGAAASSSATAGSGSSSTPSGSNPVASTTPKVVGGVVGGVAGLALILVVLLWLLRRYRKRLQAQEALSGSSGVGATSDPTDQQPVTSQPSFHTPLTAAVTPAFLGRWRQSRHSEETSLSSEALPTERGFQKLGGRKLPSVLAGGDPYGGNYGAFEKSSRAGPSRPEDKPPSRSGGDTLAGQSFYRDSQGFYGGVGPATSPTTPRHPDQSLMHDFADDESQGHDEGLPVMRPSPARTPIRASASIASIPRTPGSNAPSVPRPPDPDGVGRTLSFHDGSRGSRFTESV